ncbi:MAG: hypothetical protein R3D58_02935 [Saprospiraceae bacterium]
MKAVAHNEEDRTKAILVSVILHAILLALLFFLQIAVKEQVLESPPIAIEWGGGGDDAAAGQPDLGQGDTPADVGQQLDDPSSQEPAVDPAPSTPATTSPPPSPSKPSTTTTPTTTDPNAAALRRAQEEAKRRQEQERQRQKEESDLRAEQERQRQAELDRQRREQEELEKKKGKFGSSFGKPGSSGSGQGNTGQPGNQGTTDGTGSNPFGKTAGSGGGSGGGDGGGVGESIGGGLGGRRVIGRPSMVDDTQKTGKVAVRVCVNADGSVRSASYTQLGSTTTDSVLRNKALSWARQYRFAASNVAEQCGTITFDFRVK